MNLDQRVAELEHQLRLAQRDLNHVPLYLPPLPQFRVLQVIGGQLIENNDVIQYSSTDPSLSQLYNPDVDTTYPSGMGRAWLMSSQGVQMKRILVRHDFAGRQAPLEGGWTYVIRGSKLLTVASGPSAGQTMVAMLVTYPV